jgi:hypothetical protein
MYLNISNTGHQINQELADYLEANFAGVGYNQIYIERSSETYDRSREVNITYPGFQNTLRNTACIFEENLNQNITDWLNTL